MKYLTAIIALFVAAPLASADVIGVKGDAGVWRSDISGDLDTRSASELGYSDEGNRYVHLSVEHPVPFVPNGRIAYADVNVSRGNAALRSHIDLSHVDATAYYELLDNWISLDMGLSLRAFDGHIGLDTPLGEDSMRLDDVLPMGYAAAEAELPFTGWSAAVEVNYTQFDDYTINDYTLKVRYLFDSVLDIGAEGGYRSFALDLDKGLNTDLTLSGPFVGLAFHF